MVVFSEPTRLGHTRGRDFRAKGPPYKTPALVLNSPLNDFLAPKISTSSVLESIGSIKFQVFPLLSPSLCWERQSVWVAQKRTVRVPQVALSVGRKATGNRACGARLLRKQTLVNTSCCGVRNFMKPLKHYGKIKNDICEAVPNTKGNIILSRVSLYLGWGEQCYSVIFTCY